MYVKKEEEEGRRDGRRRLNSPVDQGWEAKERMASYFRF